MEYEEGDIVKVEVEAIVLCKNENDFYDVELCIDRAPVVTVSQYEIIEKM